MSEEKTTPVIRLKKGHLAYLVGSALVAQPGWLNAPIHATQARARNRALRLFREKAVAFEEERIALLNAVCEKDEKGNPKLKDGQYELSDEGRKTFVDDYNKALNEEILVDVTETTKGDLLVAGGLLRNLNAELDATSTDVYEKILEAFDEAGLGA